jgi:hypothetical protein
VQLLIELLSIGIPRLFDKRYRRQRGTHASALGEAQSLADPR